MSKLPADANQQYLVDPIRRAMPEIWENYYLDTWLFLNPLLTVGSPDTLYQMMQEHPFPKHENLADIFTPFN